MPTARTFKEAIVLFNEKSALVQQRSFIKRMLAESTGYRIKGTVGQPAEFTFDHPDEESVEATTITCRYFLEPRDGCSFEKLAGHYDDAANPIDQSLRDEYKGTYGKIEAFLNETSPIEKLNNRELLYTIVYGEIAHSNPDKQAVVARWKKAGPMFYIAYAEFTRVLAYVVVGAMTVETINVKALKQLG